MIWCLDWITSCDFCWSKCFVCVCVGCFKKKKKTGHPGHEHPETLYPSGRNEPLCSVPLLPLPAELRKQRRAATERSGRTQRPFRSLQHNPRAGGVPQRAGCGHGAVMRPIWIRNCPLCWCWRCSEATWPAGGRA